MRDYCTGLVIKHTFQEAHSSAGDPISDAFAEQFSDELSKEFEDAMKNFLSDDPAMMQQIEKLAEAAGAAGNMHDFAYFIAKLWVTISVENCI